MAVMIRRKIQIKNKKGIHLRPSSIIAKMLQKTSDKVVLYAGKQTVKEFSVFSILGLCLRYNDYVLLQVDGPDEQNTIKKLQCLFEHKYDFT